MRTCFVSNALGSLCRKAPAFACVVSLIMIYLAFILVRFNVPVHVYFDKEERPFLLDADMRWSVEPNAFLVYVSVINGKTGSPRTWRSYAYQLADWLVFFEKIAAAQRRATLLKLATYLNILLKDL